MDYQVINHTKELAGARTHEQENSWHALQWVLPSPSKESQPLCINSKRKQELIIVQLLDVRLLQQNKNGKGNTSVHIYWTVYLFLFRERVEEILSVLISPFYSHFVFIHIFQSPKCYFLTKEYHRDLSIKK